MLSLNSKSIAKQIVLVDEDLDECKCFQDALERLNFPYSLTTVNDRETLFKLLNDTHFIPDFIFLGMVAKCAPDMNSLKLIKKTIKVCSIPVIVFSKFTKPGSIDYCYETEACEYFLRALSFLL